MQILQKNDRFPTSQDEVDSNAFSRSQIPRRCISFLSGSKNRKWAKGRIRKSSNGTIEKGLAGALLCFFKSSRSLVALMLSFPPSRFAWLSLPSDVPNGSSLLHPPVSFSCPVQHYIGLGNCKKKKGNREEKKRLCIHSPAEGDSRGTTTWKHSCAAMQLQLSLAVLSVATMAVATTAEECMADCVDLPSLRPVFHPLRAPASSAISTLNRSGGGGGVGSRRPTEFTIRTARVALQPDRDSAPATTVASAASAATRTSSSATTKTLPHGHHDDHRRKQNRIHQSSFHATALLPPLTLPVPSVIAYVS